MWSTLQTETYSTTLSTVPKVCDPGSKLQPQVLWSRGSVAVQSTRCQSTPVQGSVPQSDGLIWKRSESVHVVA